MENITDYVEGERVRVVAMECGKAFKRRLAELGLFGGTEIEIVKNDGRSPLLIKIFDSKIVLGRGEAEKIYGKKI